MTRHSRWGGQDGCDAAAEQPIGACCLELFKMDRQESIKKPLMEWQKQPNTTESIVKGRILWNGLLFRGNFVFGRMRNDFFSEEPSRGLGVAKMRDHPCLISKALMHLHKQHKNVKGAAFDKNGKKYLKITPKSRDCFWSLQSM